MGADSKKRALITGITGQDGSYLAELLLAQGLRGARHHPPLLELQHRPDRPPLPRPARARRAAVHSTTATSTTPVALTRLIYEAAAGRDLQPRRAEPRARLLRHARVHRRRHRPRHAAPARGDPRVRASRPRFYQAVVLGDVRRLAAAAERGDAVPPAQPLRACAKVAAYWAHGQLPRGLRHVRRQRHPLQPRVARAAARPSSPARSPAPSPASSTASQDKLFLGNLDAERDWGYAPRLRRGDVADAAGRRARRLRRRHRRDALRARVRSSVAFAPRRPRPRRARRDRPPLLPPDRGRRAARRRRARPASSSAGSRRCASAS